MGVNGAMRNWGRVGIAEQRTHSRGTSARKSSQVSVSAAAAAICGIWLAFAPIASAGPAIIDLGPNDGGFGLCGGSHVVWWEFQTTAPITVSALAAHDLEVALYGTSLGYGLAAGRAVPHGHEHHLRTINRIRALGSIHKAVESGLITSGIMAAAVQQGLELVMAGTIRDDGPLPGVITDSIAAQRAMPHFNHDVTDL